MVWLQEMPRGPGQHVPHLFKAGDVDEVLSDKTAELSIADPSSQHEAAKVRPMFLRDAVALANPLNFSPGHAGFYDKTDGVILKFRADLQNCQAVLGGNPCAILG